MSSTKDPGLKWVRDAYSHLKPDDREVMMDFLSKFETTIQTSNNFWELVLRMLIEHQREIEELERDSRPSAVQK